MSKDLADILADLHGAIAEEFLERVRSGEASPADLNAARQFLKDNGITALAKPKSPLAALAEELPFSSPDEIAQPDHPATRKH